MQRRHETRAPPIRLLPPAAPVTPGKARSRAAWPGSGMGVRPKLKSQNEKPSSPGSGIMSGLQGSGRISTLHTCETALSAAAFTSASIWGA